MSLDDHHDFTMQAQDEWEHQPDGDEDRPAGAPLPREHALAFLLAGAATFTLHSLRSGLHHSYRVKAVLPSLLEGERRAWHVELLTGPNNTQDWTEVARLWVDLEGQTRIRLRGTWSENAPSFRALWWTVCRLSQGKDTPELEIHHMGTCGACGRLLTTPESIRRGLGPVCAERGS